MHPRTAPQYALTPSYGTRLILHPLAAGTFAEVDKPSTWIRKRRGVEFAVVHQPNGAIVNASNTRGTAPSATIEVCT
jgi:hypothetical protein